MRKRGYYGIAVLEPKFEENFGTIFRLAQAFNVNFFTLIGKRFKQTAINTSKGEKHLPVFEYRSLDDFLNHLPIGCSLVCAEVDGKDIKNFVHPERAVYLFGGEDRTLPIIKGERIRIDTPFSLNVAIAAAVICYDRQQKLCPQ